MGESRRELICFVWIITKVTMEGVGGDSFVFHDFIQRNLSEKCKFYSNIINYYKVLLKIKKKQL